MTYTLKPYTNALSKNPHYTETLVNALRASLQNVERAQQGTTGGKYDLCVNASLSAVYALLDELKVSDVELAEGTHC